MRKELLTIITMMFLLTVFGNAQENDAMTYRLRAKLPLAVTSKYKFTEIQDIKRKLKIGRDWEEMSLQRKVSLFYSLRAADKLANGFTDVKISVDSIVYELTSPDKKVIYNSWDISAFPPINETDFLRYGFGVEQDYNFLYSPYSEVSKITSEHLVKKRELFTGADVAPSKMKDLVKEYLSDRMLVFIFDPMKNILPDYDIQLEDTWSPTVDIEMGGYWWNFKPEFKISSYDRSGFLLESDIDSVRVDKGPVYFSDMESWGTISDSHIDGKISSFLSTQGRQESALLNFDVKLMGEVGGREFTQTQNIFYSWELLGTYKF